MKRLPPTSPMPRRPATAASTWRLHGALAAALGTGDKATVEHTAFTTQADASVGVTQADGNSIDVDNESAKLAANALEQQAAVSVLKARTAIMRSALGVA